MPTQKPFWVFVDKPTKKARLHRAACGACKKGRGMHGHQDGQCWWEGFETRPAAWDYASNEALAMRVAPSACGLCKP